ncbi:MAG: sugar transferase [Herbinix sp.]|jgi:lipopolysaccharide/colanic/teichoic acid biosynthesis glycosyltransferase|nr:sugar transferase [Herbinix sp.]
MVRKNLYSKHIKRPMDVIIALIAILLLSPAFIATAVLILIKMGPPILFRQRRPGLNGDLFTLYKFRTMTNQRNQKGQLLPDKNRLLPFGSVLRAKSLDELPELFNVLKGDMSIVGPRPLLAKYLPLYNDQQKYRHKVRPGITGLAQVNGRNTISWEDKFKLDCEYIRNISFIGDIKIIIVTLFKVLKQEGIHSHNSATMEEFKGNASEETTKNC